MSYRGGRRRRSTGDTIRWNAGDVRPGNSSSFQVTQQDQTFPVQATLERDADHDGYGDETQDRCPSDPTLHSVCDTFPPQTTITQGPRKRTTSRTANFAFTSSEPASTFQCSLDGAAFR